MTRDTIQQFIFDALVLANHARDDDDQIPIGPETALYGVNGRLDSMGLVGFLIDVEESLQDQGIRISLSDERAMSQKNSPFRDVPTLVDYISHLIGDAA
jgi:acyl carrier protein